MRAPLPPGDLSRAAPAKLFPLPVRPYTWRGGSKTRRPKAARGARPLHAAAQAFADMHPNCRCSQHHSAFATVHFVFHPSRPSSQLCGSQATFTCAQHHFFFVSVQPLSQLAAPASQS
uniref:Uncharacterized protein n=1 Tax=Strombidinopsis acuminata TaxID=141414 RepID=A0A7S3X551_9SPIT